MPSFVDHQIAKRFKKKTDLTFKHDEFEKSFAEFMIGFVQCYPHLVKKEEIRHMPDSEMWIFKFWVDDPEREKMLQEFKVEMTKK